MSTTSPTPGATATHVGSPSTWSGLATYARLDLRRQLRDRLGMFFMVGLPAFMYLVFGLGSDDPVGSGLVLDIGLKSHGLALVEFQIGDKLFGGLGARLVRESHFCTLGGQRPDNRLADASAASGHQCRLASQPHSVVVFL